jgi:hypothetical protein
MRGSAGGAVSDSRDTTNCRLTGRAFARALTVLGPVAALLAVTLTTSANAAPVMTLSAGFAEGTHQSEATMLTDTVGISGTEYGGDPLPLTELTVRFPKGTVLSNAGFATCAKTTLQPSGTGPVGCAGSKAGPTGTFNAGVAFGAKIEREEGTAETFFSEEGGLLLYLFGHNPALIEVLATGHYVAASGSTGPGVAFEVPLTETVPGAPFASITGLSLNLGAFREEHGATVGSVTAPGECSTSMGWEASGKFADGKGAEAAAHGETSTPCLPSSKPAPSGTALEILKSTVGAEEAAARKKAEEAALAKSQVDAFTAAAHALSSFLSPHGHAAKIGAILKHGGYTLTPTIPAGTTLTIDWYKVPKGLHLAAQKPVVVAAGSASPTASGPVKLTIKLTNMGKRLLRQSKTVMITARGTLKPTTGTAATKLRTFRLKR